MTNDKAEVALRLLDQFEREGSSNPHGAERLIANILRACGQNVTESGFIGSPDGFDCYFRTTLDGKPQLIGVEVKANKRPTPADVVEKAFHLKSSGPFDRVMIVASGGFSRQALDHADALGLGQIDLLVPNDLRNWIIKHNTPPEQAAPTEFEKIIRHAMRDLAGEIANDPQRLWDAQWFDLERILRETFEGLGFETRLTRPAKDGGFDLELSFSYRGAKQTYLVEVKHWAEKKPGAAQLKKLIRVTAERQATGGLLLSSSGFTKTVSSGITEYEKPIRLADSSKIVSLCKTYYRLSSALWTQPLDLNETLFDGTTALGAK